MVFDASNAAGGVFGRKITYKVLDDGFDPKRSAENTSKLLGEDNAFLIFMSTGTAQNVAILPLLSETKSILFGPVSGGAVFRENFNRYVFNVRGSYLDECKAIFKQFGQVSISKVVVFYQDDGLGNAVLSDAKKAAASQKFDIAGFVKLDPKQPDFKAAAEEIAKLSPQAVLMASAGGTFSNLVKAVAQTSARPNFYGLSIVSSTGIAKSLGPLSRGLVLSQVMPSLRNLGSPVVVEYLQALKAKNASATPSATQFEGYLHAKILLEAFRRTGRNLNTESLIKTLESSGPFTLGKFTASYSASAHIGSTYVELAVLDAEGNLRY
jgi:ABC-type branched-subunit amino acid transport system substrate-binding protein